MNKQVQSSTYLAAALLLALGSLAAPRAHAADEPAKAASARDDWQFRASVYAYVPEISGDLQVATPAGSTFEIGANDLIKNAHSASMFNLQAQKGRLGLFTDVVYMNIGDSMEAASTLGNGSIPLPPGVSADASLDIEATVLTLGASWRLRQTRRDEFDLLAGARMLDAEGEFEWQLNSPAGPLPPPAGHFEGRAGKRSWDGIVGFKGRHSFGSRDQWFIPYYVDVGAGAADFTWQAAAGIGYSARWGETFLTWRHLSYEFGTGRAIESLQTSGPALGVAFRW